MYHLKKNQSILNFKNMKMTFRFLVVALRLHYLVDAVPRLYDLIAVDKSIDETPYNTVIGPQQYCISLCTLDPECFSFDFTPSTRHGTCNLYEITFSLYTNQSRALATRRGTSYYSTFPKDCQDFYTMGLRESGVFQVHLLGKYQRNVYCVMDR